MDYRDTGSFSRAQLKSKGERQRSHGWLYHYTIKGHRDGGGKGMKAGRHTAGDALKIDIGADKGSDE